MLPVLQAIKEQVWQETRIHIDGARWYDDACKWLRLKHIVYGTELKKNLMERDSFSISKTGLSALTTISLVEMRVATGSMYGTG